MVVITLVGCDFCMVLLFGIVIVLLLDCAQIGLSFVVILLVLLD